MKTTLLLLLLPLQSLAQCFGTNAQLNWGSSNGYPAECEFVAGGGYPLDCLGCRHRQPIFRIIQAPGGIYQLNFQANVPVVWGMWAGNPCNGAALIASAACGGWTYWCGDDTNYRVGVDLPAGEVWIWTGTYSDCQTCETGIINVTASPTNNPCQPPVVTPPCGVVNATLGYGEATHCGHCQTTPISPLPCPNMVQTTYTSLNFTVTWDVPTPITMTSAMNYTFNPNGPSVWAHAAIIDANGVAVWTTVGGACSITSDAVGTYPAANWEAWVNLPHGSYTLVFGYFGIDNLQPQMFGCATATVGFPMFLELIPDDHDGSPRWSGGEYVPRYTKVVILGRGVFIRDGHTGKLYDVVTRGVVGW
jgi:hypothetical protein